MIQQLIQALIASENEAADEVLLEALRLGNVTEQGQALDALIKRETTRGLGGVIGLYDALPDPLKLRILNKIRAFHHALREAGRSDDVDRRLAALKLIALGRQGKLAYVLSENLHDLDESLSKAACEAVVALSRWISTETRRLQRGETDTNLIPEIYKNLMEQRAEIESAVARALDLHRG